MGGQLDGIMAWLVLISGAYLFYCGITKSGGLYKNEYPKDIKPQIDKSVSIFARISGAVLVIGSLLEILVIFPEAQAVVVLSTVGLTLVLWVGYLIYFRKKFGPYIR